MEPSPTSHGKPIYLSSLAEIGEPTPRPRRRGGAASFPPARPSAAACAGAGGQRPPVRPANAARHRQPASASRLGECWRLCQKSPGILCDVRLSGVHREKHLNLMTAKIPVTMKRLL